MLLLFDEEVEFCGEMLVRVGFVPRLATAAEQLETESEAWIESVCVSDGPNAFTMLRLTARAASV